MEAWYNHCSTKHHLAGLDWRCTLSLSHWCLRVIDLESGTLGSWQNPLSVGFVLLDISWPCRRVLNSFLHQLDKGPNAYIEKLSAILTAEQPRLLHATLMFNFYYLQPKAHRSVSITITSAVPVLTRSRGLGIDPETSVAQQEPWPFWTCLNMSQCFHMEIIQPIRSRYPFLWVKAFIIWAPCVVLAEHISAVLAHMWLKVVLKASNIK